MEKNGTEEGRDECTEFPRICGKANFLETSQREGEPNFLPKKSVVFLVAPEFFRTKGILTARLFPQRLILTDGNSNFGEPMKTTLALLLLTTGLSSQAAIVQFDLSPAGTDKAVGLSPSNQVPAAATSSGSGNEISGGIVFDTRHFRTDRGHRLWLRSGIYGSHRTGHRHAHPWPGRPGTNASVLISLVPLNFSAANPTNGGVIFGTVTIPSNSVPDLLAGLDYINIHTPIFRAAKFAANLLQWPRPTAHHW